MAYLFRYFIPVIVAVAVMAAAAPVLAEDPPPDYDDPCLYIDPTLWGDLCRPWGGGGDTNPCEGLEGVPRCLCDCAVQYNRAINTCKLVPWAFRWICNFIAFREHTNCQVGCTSHRPLGQQA